MFHSFVRKSNNRFHSLSSFTLGQTFLQVLWLFLFTPACTRLLVVAAALPGRLASPLSRAAHPPDLGNPEKTLNVSQIWVACRDSHRIRSLPIARSRDSDIKNMSGHPKRLSELGATACQSWGISWKSMIFCPNIHGFRPKNVSKTNENQGKSMLIWHAESWNASNRARFWCWIIFCERLTRAR